WQNNRQVGMRKDAVFVEGIFEELDAPGEWFLDRATHMLYYYPPAGLDLAHATFEGVGPASLVEFRGTEAHPVRNVSFEGFVFQRTARTFMQNREPLLRSDWTTFRGGAVFALGTEGCSIRGCFFDAVGGNAVFVSGFNRHFTVGECRIENAGANGVAFVGDPKAVRSPLFEYNQRHRLAEIDRHPGPKTDDYPSDCLVDDCLIARTGRIEKQSAPVEISMSRRITVRDCSIYDVPRAGINIGDGCWGGHLIEGCDVFDTVKETGDHGSFNSWGRDRYWGLTGVDLNDLDRAGLDDLPLLDVVEPITLRHNRWRCDHGWDIDLDDGSSNFRIVDNLCLHGGLKLREGFHRVCENNVIVGNSFHMHVWFKDSHDVIERNIVFTPYQVIEVPKPWGDACDYNLLHLPKVKSPIPADMLAALSGRDSHSVASDAEFVDAATGDYRVQPGSPALKLGFKNFATDRFGVRSATLRRLAKTPVLP
ncbi:MAG: right-handed parallel beta-helix repeat-containing protein, partial [Fimbriimonas sp.]|nr:right-handed parallel beta-helix repeat-containing protein [Fimbriimonas sp.]